MKAVSGLEKEPEKGARCEVCFEKRFLRSAQKALEIGENKITTTLLVSPLKSQEQLKRVGDAFYKKHGVKFIAVDYRSGGGTQDQSRVTKEQQLYRQDYCGCIYGLTMQREQQNKLMDEMFSPITKQIAPASIEERIELYNLRNKLEDEDKPYKIIRQKFLNYRQFFVKVIAGKKENIAAHALSYSTLPRKKAQGRIEFTIDEISYFNREEIKFITLSYYNNFFSTNYQTVKELIFSPQSLQKELTLREYISNSSYDLTPIIVVKDIPQTKLTLFLDSKVYEDTREKLIII